MSFLTKIDHERLKQSFEILSQTAISKNISIWAGSAVLEDDKWFNAAIGFMSNGTRQIYRKVNLANAERGVFTAGDELTVFQDSNLVASIQLCREIRFPEQWGLPARLGAQIFVHLNNAVGDDEIYPIWKSHLISRAAETQRFVVSVNNADHKQKCPTLIVDPNGKVLVEIKSERLEVARASLDLTKVSSNLLSQSRDDIVAINKPHSSYVRRLRL